MAAVFALHCEVDVLADADGVGFVVYYWVVAANDHVTWRVVDDLHRLEQVVNQVVHFFLQTLWRDELDVGILLVFKDVPVMLCYIGADNEEAVGDEPRHIHDLLAAALSQDHVLHGGLQRLGETLALVLRHHGGVVLLDELAQLLDDLDLDATNGLHGDVGFVEDVLRLCLLLSKGLAGLYEDTNDHGEHEQVHDVNHDRDHNLESRTWDHIHQAERERAVVVASEVLEQEQIVLVWDCVWLRLVAVNTVTDGTELKRGQPQVVGFEGEPHEAGDHVCVDEDDAEPEYNLKVGFDRLCHVRCIDHVNDLLYTDGLE